MPKIDLSKTPVLTGTRYPAPHDVPCRERHRLRLGDVAPLGPGGGPLRRVGPALRAAERLVVSLLLGGGDRHAERLAGRRSRRKEPCGDQRLRHIARQPLQPFGDTWLKPNRA